MIFKIRGGSKHSWFRREERNLPVPLSPLVVTEVAVLGPDLGTHSGRVKEGFSQVMPPQGAPSIYPVNIHWEFLPRDRNLRTRPGSHWF